MRRTDNKEYNRMNHEFIDSDVFSYLDDKSESCWNDYLFFKCLKCDYCICYPKIEHENSIVIFSCNKNTYYNISNSLKYAHYNKNLNLTCEEIQIKNIIE